VVSVIEFFFCEGSTICNSDSNSCHQSKLDVESCFFSSSLWKSLIMEFHHSGVSSFVLASSFSVVTSFISNLLF